MGARTEESAIILIIVVISFSFVIVKMDLAFSSGFGGKIDLYTQKELFNGFGSNVPSDAFGPDEVVILFASVTYNDIPVKGLLVAFDVRMPSGASFSFSERTNSSGISSASFTIPKTSADLNESEIFGQWQALANVIIVGETFQDTLTFRVDWVVKLVSVRTIDGNLTHRNNFGIGGDVGFEIVLRSISMVIKEVAISGVLKDELSVPVNFFEIDRVLVRPNDKLVFLYFTMEIPRALYIGNATLEVSIFHDSVEEGGVPYCPKVIQTVTIEPIQPLTVTFHDRAVIEVVSSPVSVEVGQVVNISAVVQDEGSEAENFTLNIYCNDTHIGAVPTALESYSDATLDFVFDTSALVPGNYTLTLSIPSLSDEADLTDNLYVSEMIEVKPKAPPVVHDIAVVEIEVTSTSLYIGESLRVSVDVTNIGTEAETFDVGAYYNFSLIELLSVQALAPQAKKTLVFLWDTSSVEAGSYQISAFAPLANDVNMSDNALVYGFIKVEAASPRTYLLGIASNPVSGISFTIDGIGQTTNYSATLEENNYNITMPSSFAVAESGKTYSFERWENGLTTARRTVFLNKDMNLTAYYKEAADAFVPNNIFWWLLLGLLLLLLFILLILLILWLCGRKRKSRESFYTGWSAWYYGYDRSGENHRN